MKKQRHSKHKIKDCKELFHSLKNPIIQYKNTGKRGRTGLIIAFKTPGNIVSYSWSLCNLKLDIFNKYIGVAEAISNRLLPITEFDIAKLPQSLRKEAASFINRAKKYYKDENL